MAEDASAPRIKRRRLLQAGGGVLAALAGCPGSDRTGTGSGTSGRRTPATGSNPKDGIPAAYAERFDSIVDVTEAGASANGSEPIDAVVRSAAKADTLLVFPAGRYRVDNLSIAAPDNFGLVAPPSADASLVPPRGEPDIEWLSVSDATDFLYDGLDFDVRGRGPVGGTVFAGPGDLTIRNLGVRGSYETGDQQLLRVDVTEDGGSGLVERVAAAGVDKAGVDTTGLYVGRTHAGALTFRNCRLDGFSDNAIYASAPGGDGGQEEAGDGAVHVRGGLFRNNNIAAIRVGSTGSTVRGATVIVDELPTHMDDDSLNARGIRLRGTQDQLVENCRLVYGADVGETSGALTINGANGRATVRNVKFEIHNDDTRAIYAKAPERDGPVAPTFENITISGSAANGATATIVDRPETTFTDCCINQSGDRRDGIQFIESTGCAVRDSLIDVAGSPIVLENSSVTSRSVTETGNGRCVMSGHGSGGHER